MKITTRAMLVEHITSNIANTTDSVIRIYAASRTFSKTVTEIKMKRSGIHIARPIHFDGEMSGEFLYYDGEYGLHHTSLRDHNIGEGSGYNDWFWFTTRDSAEEYLNPKPLEFEVGAKYQWNLSISPHNQGRRHGPLTCVYLGTYQGMFSSEREDSAGFENKNGLHIVARQHLREGRIVKVV